MSKIDFSNLTAYIPEAVRDLNDLIKKAAFEHPDMRKYMTIVDGIEHDKKIGFYDNLADVGMKGHASACTLNEVTANVETSEKSWTPKTWDTRLILCADDINNTIAQKTLKKGIDRYDMTETQYMDLFQELLVDSIVRMYNRFTWLGDLNAAKFSDSPPGHITDAKNLNYINVVDAAWKQIYSIMSTTPAQRVTISENAQSTYATQENISKADALGYIRDLIFKAPMVLRQEILKGGYTIMCTQHLFDKFAENFQGFELESQRTELENGIIAQKFHGVPVYPEPALDVMIQEWHDDGSKWYRPNRALLFSKNNLLLGVPSIQTWGAFDMFYERKDKKVYIDMEDKVDVKILHDNLVMAAY